MRIENNKIISSEAKLSSIAWVMFFAPFVKNRIKSDSSLNEEEKSFIKWYTQVWYINILFLMIVLATCVLNFFIQNNILSLIITIWSLIIFIISIFSIFTCINSINIRTKNDSIIQKNQHKLQLLKAYTPFLNFILRFRQENYNMPYRWLKESILLRSIFIFGTLLLWNLFGIWTIIIIIIRIISLLFNIDILSIDIKKSINSMFLCNPSEISAYIFAPIISKIKKSDYNTILQSIKEWYATWQSFGLWIILQYILLTIIVAALFLLYYSNNALQNNVIRFIAIILWISKIITFYVYKKKFLRIPFLYEILSPIFK